MNDTFSNSSQTGQKDETSTLILMEFTIAGQSFGINVSKVTEIMRICPIKPMQRAHEYIEGIVMLRGTLVNVINLPKYLNLHDSENMGQDMLMLTNFHSVNAAFRVHTVEQMHHIKWSEVDKPSAAIYGIDDSIITGTIKIGDNIITLIDFEKILYDISPGTGLQMSDVHIMGEREQSKKPIVIVEDSVFLKKMISEAIEMAGYTNITSFDNGQDAWDYLRKVKEICLSDNIPIEHEVTIVVTDIEMPRMDGHHLTKLIKGDELLKKIPVLVFSSLVDEAQKSQGESVGVNAHLSKPQIGQLVSTIDHWIL